LPQFPDTFLKPEPAKPDPAKKGTPPSGK